MYFLSQTKQFHAPRGRKCGRANSSRGQNRSKIMIFQGGHPQKCCTVVSGPFSPLLFSMFPKWLPGALPGASGTLPAAPPDPEISHLIRPEPPPEKTTQFFYAPGRLPGRLSKQGRRPRAAQTPPGRLSAVILAPFWSPWGSIFHVL